MDCKGQINPAERELRVSAHIVMAREQEGGEDLLGSQCLYWDLHPL